VLDQNLFELTTLYEAMKWDPRKLRAAPVEDKGLREPWCHRGKHFQLKRPAGESVAGLFELRKERGKTQGCYAGQ
jgi:hypothetical protein